MRNHRNLTMNLIDWNENRLPTIISSDHGNAEAIAAASNAPLSPSASPAYATDISTSNNTNKSNIPVLSNNYQSSSPPHRSIPEPQPQEDERGEGVPNEIVKASRLLPYCSIKMVLSAKKQQHICNHL